MDGRMKKCLTPLLYQRGWMLTPSLSLSFTSLHSSFVLPPRLLPRIPPRPPPPPPALLTLSSPSSPLSFPPSLPRPPPLHFQLVLLPSYANFLFLPFFHSFLKTWHLFRLLNVFLLSVRCLLFRPIISLFLNFYPPHFSLNP